MHWIGTPEKIQIYINNNRKSASQIQQELKCDVLINGGLFDMSRFTPNCWLKANNKLLHSESWSDYGFGWYEVDPIRIAVDTSANISKYQDFISCVMLVKDGKMLNLSYPQELGGRRGRTAIGIMPSGKVLAFCTKDGSAYALSPEELQLELKQLGVLHGLMLDGGGSSQCIMPDGIVPSSRIVHNYIAIWIKKEAQTPNPQLPSTEPTCPYAEPTHTVGRWCFFYSKDEAKWVQWNLVRKGYLLDYNEVDGAFGPKSDKALRSFQKDAGLVADGFCGPKSREELKK